MFFFYNGTDEGFKDPSSIDSLRAWWDASDDSGMTLSGTEITAWTDKTGNWTASQFSTLPTPNLDAVNNAASFDASSLLVSDGSLADWGFLHQGAVTVFIVATFDDIDDDNNSLISTGGAGAPGTAGFQLTIDTLP